MKIYLLDLGSLVIDRSDVLWHIDVGTPVRFPVYGVYIDHPTGKYIFVNRAGVKVVENNREGLAQAYRRGELSVLDEGRLFDRALESVIGNLREMRNRGS